MQNCTKKNTVLCCFFLLVSMQTIYAQIGGQSTFQFLNFQPGARVAALGGIGIVNPDNDIQFAIQNPALIKDTLHKSISLSYVAYLADIKIGNAAFAYKHKKLGTLVGGLHFINYGQFEFNDATGNNTGTFSAGEQVFSLGTSRTINHKWQWGATAKFINSNLANLHSNGIAFDVALLYTDTTNRLLISLLAKNIGTQIKTYTPSNYEPLPYDFQLGISQRLKHLPFRYGIIIHHLHRWDIRYDDPNDQHYKQRLLDINGQQVTENKRPFGDILLRHIVLNGEISVSPNFHVQVAYNHLRRAELGIPNKNALGGFSWGFGFKVSKFQLSYASAAIGLVGATNHFTIATNLGAF